MFPRNTCRNETPMSLSRSRACLEISTVGTHITHIILLLTYFAAFYITVKDVYVPRELTRDKNYP